MVLKGWLQPVHKPLDPLQRLFDLLISRGIASPRKALAAQAKRIARHHRHVLFLQQPVGKGVIIQPGDAHLGEGVESAVRLKGWQADLVQLHHDQLAAAVVFLHHPFHVFLAVAQRLEGRRTAQSSGRT